MSDNLWYDVRTCQCDEVCVALRMGDHVSETLHEILTMCVTLRIH